MFLEASPAPAPIRQYAQLPHFVPATYNDAARDITADTTAAHFARQARVLRR